MRNTLLFDLDGTLLPLAQKDFVEVYFAELGKKFAQLGLDPHVAIKATWAGTKAMMLNDGACTNAERFWAAFASLLSLTEERRAAIETACDDFYANEFDKIKSLFQPSGVPPRMIRALLKKGRRLILATNPLFPAVAVETRLRWIGLETKDFAYVTHYSNSSFCKPNPGYYREIFDKNNLSPDQCLMIGNNTTEDMCAAELGVETFLVTDCLENEANMDINTFRHGTLEELEAYLLSF
jgi:FMN phosphatase YigB (HAD superfamily)